MAYKSIKEYCAALTENLEKENEALQTQVELLKNGNPEHLETIRTLSEINAAYTKRISDLEVENASLKESVGGHQSRISALDAENALLKKEISELKAKTNQAPEDKRSVATKETSETPSPTKKTRTRN